MGTALYVRNRFVGTLAPGAIGTMVAAARALGHRVFVAPDGGALHLDSAVDGRTVVLLASADAESRSLAQAVGERLAGAGARALITGERRRADLIMAVAAGRPFVVYAPWPPARRRAACSMAAAIGAPSPRADLWPPRLLRLAPLRVWADDPQAVCRGVIGCFGPLPPVDSRPVAAVGAAPAPPVAGSAAVHVFRAVAGATLPPMVRERSGCQPEAGELVPFR